MKLKKFSKLLSEMAPPADWDRDVFKHSFKKQIEYAVARASKLGSGSSRVVFEIEYQGRPTVLKIAKNPKGFAQNEVEGDWGMHRMYSDILIPLIDIDEENDEPRWIHMEKAEKISKGEFKSKMGFTFDHFGKMLYNWEQEMSGKNKGAHINWLHGIPEDVQEQIIESELFSQVTDLAGNFDMPVGDWSRIANWGMFKGNPVIIDFGLNREVYKQHYEPKPKPQQFRHW